MIIKDRVYQKITVDNKLIQDIILSAPLQRLKHINQYGGSVFLEPKRDVTRFEHSIGVWYLLSKFNASLEEQIAGLLHDVPHTAFSHVIDLVYPNAEDNFHERFHEQIILNSQLPQILSSHHIDIYKVLDTHNYSLLEAKLPDLSADRLDYFFRDTRPSQLFPESLIHAFLADLIVKNGYFVFKSISYSSLFCVLFMTADKLLWTDPNSVGSFHLLARAIKRGFDIQCLSQDDIFTTDSQVFSKLKSSPDKIIQQYLSSLIPKTKFTASPPAESDYKGSVKVRAVDPLVLTKSGTKRTSDFNLGLKSLIAEHLHRRGNIGVRQTSS